MSRTGTLFKRVAYIAVATVVLLEVVLQVASCAAWMTLSRAEAKAGSDRGKTVLCIGDSYTYGMGASSEGGSYPSQLEKLLRESTDQDWRAVNAGWPGRNSREILELLPAQLAEHEPAFVLLVCGVNDQWSRPERLDLAGASDLPARESFRLVWRTGRLLAWLFGDRRSGGNAIDGSRDDRPADPRADSPLADKAWLLASTPLAFLAGGTAYLGTAPLSWSVHGDVLRLGAEGVATVELSWRLDGDRLALRSAGWPAPVVLAPLDIDLKPAEEPDGESKKPDLPPANGWDLIHAGRFDDAAAVFRRRIEQARDHAALDRLGLLTAHLRGGDRKAARDVARCLETLYRDRERRDEAVVECYVRALEHLQDRRFLPLCREAVEEFPKNEVLHIRLAWHEFQNGDIAAARNAIETAVALCEQRGSGSLGWALRTQAHIEQEDAPELAVRNVVRCHLLSPDRASTIQLFQRVGKKITPEIVDRALTELKVTDPQRNEARELFAASRNDRSDRDGALAVYRAHLEQIAALCRGRGAVLVLGTYPWHDDPFDSVTQEVAAGAGAGYVDVAAEFDRRLRGKKRSDYFVSDGHCNDKGYAIFAAALGARVLRQLK